MVGLYRCPHCGSVGSIEFDMCQVCLYDYAGAGKEEGSQKELLPRQGSFSDPDERWSRRADSDLMMAGV